MIKEDHDSTGHYYLYEGKRYPSITTILHSRPNPGIEIWKNKTPNWKEMLEESQQIGTEFHHNIETYLRDGNYPEWTTHRVFKLLLNLDDELKKITNIKHQEYNMVEPDLGVAGRCDCIADYNGVPSIIDFKNSRKPKPAKYIQDYFIQLNAYSRMYQYMTGEHIDQGVILMADWLGGTKSYVIDIHEYDNQLESLLADYYANL